MTRVCEMCDEARPLSRYVLFHIDVLQDVRLCRHCVEWRCGGLDLLRMDAGDCLDNPTPAFAKRIETFRLHRYRQGVGEW